MYPVVTKLTRGHTAGGPAGELLLLNNGYEEDPPMALPLASSDEPSRFQLQFYHRVATQADLRGKHVLEVSCGHGGGASYLMRTLSPASYTGLDLNPDGIAFCRERHKLPGLYFVQGDADNLPFPDQSFDAVINIESSHCYPSLSRFLTEVARVLRPGGHFLYADGPYPLSVDTWQATLDDAPMRMLSKKWITAEIVRGFEKNLPHLLDVVDGSFPAFLHGPVNRIFGALFSNSFRDRHRVEDSYLMCCFVK